MFNRRHFRSGWLYELGVPEWFITFSIVWWFTKFQNDIYNIIRNCVHNSSERTSQSRGTKCVYGYKKSPVVDVCGNAIEYYYYFQLVLDLSLHTNACYNPFTQFLVTHDVRIYWCHRLYFFKPVRHTRNHVRRQRCHINHTGQQSFDSWLSKGLNIFDANWSFCRTLIQVLLYCSVHYSVEHSSYGYTWCSRGNKEWNKWRNFGFWRGQVLIGQITEKKNRSFRWWTYFLFYIFILIGIVAIVHNL